MHLTVGERKTRGSLLCAEKGAAVDIRNIAYIVTRETEASLCHF